MARPELSVVVVSYECAEHVDVCMRSLSAQRRDVDLEVIVVDNASTDGSAEVARSYAGVQVVNRETNTGFARAANDGMNRAQGQAVLVLNPDTTMAPGVLRACLDELWRDDAVGVLTPMVVDDHGVLDPRCHRAFPTLVGSVCFLTGLDTRLPWPAARAHVMREHPDGVAVDVDAVSGAFMLMPRAALHKVGGFDQQFFMYAEDIDLCMRFNRYGYRVRYWPGAHVTHIGGGSSKPGARPAQAEAAAYRTMAPLVRKHRPGWRGAILSATALVGGEVLLAATRMRWATRAATRSWRTAANA